MPPKSKSKPKQPRSWAKICLVAIGLFIILSIILATSYNDSDAPTDTESDPAPQGVSHDHYDDFIQISSDPEHASPAEAESEPQIIPIDYKSIIVDTEEKFAHKISDNLKLNQIINLRTSIDEYFRIHGRLPSSVVGLRSFVNAQTDSQPLFTSIRSLSSQSLADGYIYYSPTDINYPLNIPPNSVIVLGQTKCNLDNTKLGVAVAHQIVTTVNKSKSWGKPVNRLEANTTVAGGRKSLSMIFRLTLDGADYTYCHHDYPHNYSLFI